MLVGESSTPHVGITDEWLGELKRSGPGENSGQTVESSSPVAVD